MTDVYILITFSVKNKSSPKHASFPFKDRRLENIFMCVNLSIYISIKITVP